MSLFPEKQRVSNLFSYLFISTHFQTMTFVALLSLLSKVILAVSHSTVLNVFASIFIFSTAVKKIKCVLLQTPLITPRVAA